MILGFVFCFCFLGQGRDTRGCQANERQRLSLKAALKSAVLSPVPHGFLVHGPQFLVSSNW